MKKLKYNLKRDGVPTNYFVNRVGGNVYIRRRIDCKAILKMSGGQTLQTKITRALTVAALINAFEKEHKRDL